MLDVKNFLAEPADSYSAIIEKRMCATGSGTGATVEFDSPIAARAIAALARQLDSRHRFLTKKNWKRTTVAAPDDETNTRLNGICTRVEKFGKGRITIGVAFIPGAKQVIRKTIYEDNERGEIESITLTELFDQQRGRLTTSVQVCCENGAEANMIAQYTKCSGAQRPTLGEIKKPECLPDGITTLCNESTCQTLSEEVIQTIVQVARRRE
jgi:hypothetical protein